MQKPIGVQTPKCTSSRCFLDSSFQWAHPTSYSKQKLSAPQVQPNLTKLDSGVATWFTPPHKSRCCKAEVLELRYRGVAESRCRRKLRKGEASARRIVSRASRYATKIKNQKSNHFIEYKISADIVFNPGQCLSSGLALYYN